MNKLARGSVAIWRELDPAHVSGEPEAWIDHEVIVGEHGRDASGVYTEIEVLSDGSGRVLRVHRDSLRPAPRPTCLHPEHRLGTHGRLKRNQRVCLQCGALVLVSGRGK